MTKINPLNENVVVKVLEEEAEVGGMILPDTHQKAKFGAGVVLAVEGDYAVKVGDTVFFDTILLTSVKIKGEDLKFIKFSDILGYEDNQESLDNLDE